MEAVKKRHILIAEDSPTQAEMLQYLLVEAGYDIIHKTNGIEALEYVHSSPPDMIISDVMMPEMNGYELCKKIKSVTTHKDIPVLLLTTLADAEDILIGLECGADSYLMKPYDGQLLLDRVKVMFRQKENQTEKNDITKYEIYYLGNKYQLHTSRDKILDMMITTCEAAVQKTHKLEQAQYELNVLKSSLEKNVRERTSDLTSRISERRSVEESVMTSEKKYRDLVENAMLGVFVADPKGIIKFVNKALLDMLDYDTPEELIEKNIGLFFQSDADYQAMMKSVQEANKVFNHEACLVSRTNKLRWAILNVSLREKQLSGILFDLTERKTIEDRDKRFQTALTLAKEKAEESDRQKSKFLSGMSQEIKTPLNAIIGFSSLLADPLLPNDEKISYLNQVNKNTNMLSVQIHNILDFAKLEASKIHLNDVPCNLNELLDELYLETSRKLNMLTAKSLHLELIKDAQKDYSILVDSERLLQTLRNLLDNAMKFTQEGAIRFGYEMKDDSIIFFVKDSGTGIPDEYRESVFERFDRGRLNHEGQISGLGLGLTISKQLVQMMDGQIWIESGKGGGSDIFVSLPLKEVSDESKSIRSVESPSESISLKDRKILIVEDNHMNFTLLQAYLAATGAQLTWAKDRSEALGLCSLPHEFELVLMDLQMPVMNGFDATVAIRKINRQLPVIAVTAFSMAEEIDISREAGFNAFLTKPVNQALLIETILQCLANPQRSENINI